MNCIKNTGFSYLGTRNYVNSTSIIEFVHDNISIFISGLSIDYFLDIKMHKEMKVNCRVDVYSSYHEYNDETVICEVVLKFNNDKRFVYFLSNHKAISQNTVDSTYHTEEIDLYGKFSGRYRIASSSYNEFIKNIIQSNKVLHLKNIALGKFKILNIFMKNIPVELPKYMNMLDIEITNIGIRDTADGSFSTLNSINIIEMSLEPILVGFRVVRLGT
jgi:hypothetical protein